MAVCGYAFGESRLEQAVKPSASQLGITLVDKDSPADLVLINGGLSAGLRTGVICSVESEGEVVGQLMLVDLALDKSVAVMLGEYEIPADAKVVVSIEK